MFLVVGLGNPGNQYHNTRHNAGFLAIDCFAQSLRASGHACIPQTSAAFKGELLKCHDWLLLKPQTFMNCSGESVLAVRNFYKCDSVLVVHDDVDLPLGALRFKLGGGSGGHNGLRSIDGAIGNTYHRMRIGVGKSAILPTASFVLSPFLSEEIPTLTQTLQHATNALQALLCAGESWEKVASLYSLSMK